MEKNDLVRELPGLAAGITVRLTIPGGDGYQVDTDLSEESKRAAVRKGSDFRLNRLVTYFKIFDGEGNLITDFDPPLEIRIRYTGLAWALSGKYEEIPRVGFLAWGEEGWAPEWVEFSDPEYQAPKKDGEPGYLIIETESLPDPLIGGC